MEIRPRPLAYASPTLPRMYTQVWEMTRPMHTQYCSATRMPHMHVIHTAPSVIYLTNVNYTDSYSYG